FPVPFYQMHTYQLGGFVQDDWRIRPNLTLNLGIRYDYFTVPKEAHGRVFNRAPTALGPGFGDFLPADQMFKSDWPNFGPRLGFSWALGSGRKTVVRSGVGLFYNPHPNFRRADRSRGAGRPHDPQSSDCESRAGAGAGLPV